MRLRTTEPIRGEETMRSFILIPTLVIVPFAVIALLKTVTGDPMSAVVLGLVIFVTVAAWFAGPSASASPAVSRRR
ncbi:MAG TPA: hypothetical protein VES64_05360 [Allosphingosinicella sp.]|nr:hypothetical protein [Allosphingosinicella sp.]